MEISSTLCTIQNDSLVHFRTLFFRVSDYTEGEWIIGYETSDIAIALPEQGVSAIRHLQNGKSIAQTSAILKQSCAEELDIAALVNDLAAIGLVECIDNTYLAGPERVGRGWLNSIPPTWLGWLYSPPLLLCVLFVAFIGPIIFLFDPTCRPQAYSLLWSPSYALDSLTLLLLSTIFLLTHELGHLLAARSRGLEVALTIGHRLFYLVAVSRIAGIWKLSRYERLLIYSAGMLNDCFIAGVAMLILFAASHHLFFLSSQLQGLLGVIILSEYLDIMWQFQIFLKTDVYHIFADLTDRHDLSNCSRALLTGLWKHTTTFFGQDPPKELLPPSDWITRIYTLLLVIGIGGSLLWFGLYLFPATIHAIQLEIQVLFFPEEKRGLSVLDAAAALLFQLFFFLLLGISLIKSYNPWKAMKRS